MSNSYVKVLEGLYSAILADYQSSFPADHKDVERDLSRLLSLAETRGLTFFTLDLPEVGKIFDLSLSTGLLPGIPFAGFAKRLPGSNVPRFLSALWLRVFLPSGVLLEQPDITAIFFLRQLFYAAKKLRITCDESRTSKAVSDFLRIELGMRSPSLFWDEDHLELSHAGDLHFADCLREAGSSIVYSCEGRDSSSAEGRTRELFQFEYNSERPSAALLDTIQRTADIVSSSYGWFDPSEWRVKHGPGAVSDLKGGNSKYSFPTWPEKLETMFPLSEFAFANLGIWAQAVSEDSIAIHGFSRHEPPAKLIAVPKTQKSPRLIASEPTAHQWAQQSLNEFLRSMTDKSPIRSSVNFRSQLANKELALKASATGTHATIDLSSASDRLSLWVVERMFRRNYRLLEALHSCRTRWLVNEIDKELPKFIKLKKLAAQGAAFTFPTQTILYATVCIGTMIHSLGLPVTVENISRMAREVRVFGDDMIVPIDVLGEVTSCLTALGFEVNRSKTYGTGRFRESCGCDAYDGVDVTPAYYLQTYDKSRPTSVSSLVEASNNFFRKGLWATADYIVSTLPQWVQKNLAVVPSESGAFGLVSFCGLDLSHLKVRFNRELHREECRCIQVESYMRRRPAHWEANLLQYFTEAPNPDDFVKWVSGVDSLPRTRVSARWVPVDSMEVTP